MSAGPLRNLMKSILLVPQGSRNIEHALVYMTFVQTLHDSDTVLRMSIVSHSTPDEPKSA